MKHLMKYRIVQNALTVIFLFITENTLAQTVTKHTQTTTRTSNYTFLPLWAWIAGGVVALIIIIALVSRNNSSKIVIKKDV